MKRGPEWIGILANVLRNSPEGTPVGFWVEIASIACNSIEKGFVHPEVIPMLDQLVASRRNELGLTRGN